MTLGGATLEEYRIMPRLESAFPHVAGAALLAMAVLAGCRDQSAPTRLLTPGAALRTEVASAPVVNSLGDDGDGTCTDTKCTLRDAIRFASGGATITFNVTGTITLAQGQLVITKNLTIAGPGADRLAVDGHRNSREFLVTDVTATISGLTMQNGLELGGNTDFFGGGILNFGTLTLINVAISGNESSGLEGGGIWNRGALTIVGSTISGNASGNGGGILNSVGTLTITNSTFFANVAAVGAAIEDAGAMTLINSTVSQNVGLGVGAGAALDVGSQTMLLNTIVANNTNAANCSGPIATDAGFNIEDGTTCGFTAGTSHSNTDPQLDPAGLVSNGGPTLTVALFSGSPAIDLIPPGTNGCGTTIITDQRGVVRPHGAGCDAGAYEADVTGFLPPINNVRTTPIHPGKGVPIQFILGGYRGLDIFAPGSPSSVGITCPLSAGTGEVLLTDTAGNSALSYDATTDTYTYVWKTEKAWAGTCRRLIVAFGDGSVRTADFAFVR
jgi:CSLREA domain-containing protein